MVRTQILNLFTFLITLDINECKVNTVGTLCSRFSGCRNTIGSYVCACLPGYEQVGSLSNATVCVGKLKIL